jgi:hypothetical protein
MTPGSVKVPEVAWNTIWSEAPDADLKFFSSRLRARVEGVSGSCYLLENAGLAALFTANRPISSTSHTTSTIPRRRTHHRGGVACRRTA